jgi:DNA repair protein RadC
MKLCLIMNRPADYRPMAIRTPADIDRYLMPLRHSPNEQFVAVHLNSHHEIIGLHVVSEGTLNASLVHPREVFKAALLSNAHAIIVAHNHPSGSVITPSQQDLDTTEQLIAAGRLLGLSVVDHLIVGPEDEAYSIREHRPDLWKA